MTPKTTRQRKSTHKTQAAGLDPYWDVISQQWSAIIMLYEQYANKKPVMLFDIQ